MDIEKVGKAIAYLRKKAGYTQKDLADRIGISDKAVSKWERGIGLPDIAYISKLAVILDTDAEALLAGDVIHHDKGWNGLLILQDNPYGISAGTLIYDKPLVYYLLSNFLLVGIKNIYISCGQKDAEFIQTFFGDGSKLGINLHYINLHYAELQNTIQSKMNCSNVMIIHGWTLLYGVDQTRIFQRVMSYKDQVTVLSLPRNYGYGFEGMETLGKKFGMELYFNDDKKVVAIDSEEKVLTKYNFYPIPILFCPKRAICDIVTSDSNGAVSINIAYSDLETTSTYIETLNRGYYEMQINTLDDVNDTSNFVRAVQKSSGMKIGCVEEIALRRGMISKDEMMKLGLECVDTGYGKYLLSLCSDS